MADRLEAVDGDLMLFVADSFKVVSETLGYLRLLVGKRLADHERGREDEEGQESAQAIHSCAPFRMTVVR